jgi:hypothetical protein
MGMIRAYALEGRLAGKTNGEIWKSLLAKDPTITLSMLDRAIGKLTTENLIEKREKGNTISSKPETRAKYLRIIARRLRGETYDTIAKAEKLSTASVQVILKINGVRKGSEDNCVRFDTSKLVTRWRTKCLRATPS